MTVKELKEMLSTYPDNMEVFLDERMTDEFEFGLLNTVFMKEIKFSECSSGGSYTGSPEAKDTVVILSEY